VIQELYADAYVTVTLDYDTDIVVYRRTAAPFESLDAMKASYDGVRAKIDAKRLAGKLLLIDPRDAPGRNDAGFEELLSQYRDALFAPFKRHAVLVRTAAGALQTARLEQTGKMGPAPVFHDEAKARAYLLESGE
jgi:hypothetical protein